MRKICDALDGVLLHCDRHHIVELVHILLCCVSGLKLCPSGKSLRARKTDGDQNRVIVGAYGSVAQIGV